MSLPAQRCPGSLLILLPLGGLFLHPMVLPGLGVQSKPKLGSGYMASGPQGLGGSGVTQASGLMWDPPRRTKEQERENSSLK